MAIFRCSRRPSFVISGGHFMQINLSATVPPTTIIFLFRYHTKPPDAGLYFIMTIYVSASLSHTFQIFLAKGIRFSSVSAFSGTAVIATAADGRSSYFKYSFLCLTYQYLSVNIMCLWGRKSGRTSSTCVVVCIRGMNLLVCGYMALNTNAKWRHKNHGKFYDFLPRFPSESLIKEI